MTSPGAPHPPRTPAEAEGGFVVPYRIAKELSEIVSNKMQQLFDHHWIDDCWHNFLECINDIRNEK